MLKEKFVENFVRRFSQSFGRTNTYNIAFYDINELPPKVSVAINAGQKIQIYNFNAVDFNIDNKIDAILETKY